MKIDIRPFRNNDAEELSQLIIDNLMLVNVQDFGLEAVKQVSTFYLPEKIIEYSGNEEIYVGVYDSTIVGTISLDKCRIRNMFVDVQQHGKGIGKKLMHYIEKIAEESKLEKLFLYSHLSAESFYKKLGYMSVKEISENISSHIINLILMEKYLKK